MHLVVEAAGVTHRLVLLILRHRVVVVVAQLVQVVPSGRDLLELRRAVVERARGRAVPFILW